VCYDSLSVGAISATRIGRAAGLIAGVSLAVALWLAAGRGAARAEPPEVTFISPQDGDVLAEPPKDIYLCFRNPVDNADNADFEFRVLPPGGTGLGARIVFQPDGYGVDVQPGNALGPVEGEWVFTYRVSDDATKEVTEGEIRFEVRPDGQPSAAPPPPCTGGLYSPAASGRTGVTDGSGSTSGDDGGGEEDDGDSSTVLVVALVIVGVAVAGAAGLIAVRGRRREGPPV
jgi:hypothetical protein